MEKKFCFAEYNSLREEIASTKSRIRNQFVAGLILYPILISFAYKNNYTSMLLLIPFAMIAGFLLLLHENVSVMRVGHYLKSFVEGKFTVSRNNSLRWENWLEKERKNRKPSHIFRVALFVTYGVFYFISVCCFYKLFVKNFSHLFIPYTSVLLVGGYSFLFLLSLVFFVRNWQIGSNFSDHCSVHESSTYKSLPALEHEQEYMLQEYKTLRHEILKAKDRNANLFIGALTVIPSLVGIFKYLDQELLLVISPVIILSGCLIFLFEQNSIMRAARYIRKEIEPRLAGEKHLGWERFLEQNPETTRIAEKYLGYSGALFFVVYFLASSFLAGKTLYDNHFNQVTMIFLVSTYLSSLFIFLFYYIKLYPGSSSSADRLYV